MRQPSTSSTSASSWPPPGYGLPSSIEGIEGGRPPQLQQRQLWAEALPDDSKAARLARLLALPGVGLDFQAVNNDNVSGGRID
jgi:hypothetical protein